MKLKNLFKRKPKPIVKDWNWLTEQDDDIVDNIVLYNGIRVVHCTQQEYDDMDTHDSETLYVIE